MYRFSVEIATMLIIATLSASNTIGITIQNNVQSLSKETLAKPGFPPNKCRKKKQNETDKPIYTPVNTVNTKK
jgi:hypothetical protein